MTDEEKVKAKWPDAEEYTPIGTGTVIYNGKSLHLLGIGTTKSEAWADAAKRLTPAPEGHKESNDE